MIDIVRIRPVLLLLCGGFLASAAVAEFSVARIFTDGVVLQRQTEISVWGWSDAPVEVALGEASKRAEPDSDGRWKVRFPAQSAGGPYVLSVSSGDEILSFEDVWIGDVWLCSGQSNMEWSVAQSKDGDREIAAADDPMIRHFRVPRSADWEPADDLVEGGLWESATPETAGEFTAVGYFFARDLREHVDVPIGLIHASWGGSRIEPWMSAESLETDPETLRVDAERNQKKRKENLLRRNGGTLPLEDRGENDGWTHFDFDDSNWASVEVPGAWETRGWEGLDGVVWLRTEFEVDKAEAGEGVDVELGPIDDDDVAWVNGHEIGRTQGWDQERNYRVESEVLRPGRNVLVVRVEDHLLGGGLWGEEDLLQVVTFRRRMSLAGKWKMSIGAYRDGALDDTQTPTRLYAQMIHPLLDFPIRGVLWYQGESNAGEDDAYEYRDLFQTMIQDWRGRWNRGDFMSKLPFLFVQLAAFGEEWETPPEESSWAVLRESQTTALSLPETAQAVIYDLGEAHDVHPLNKQDVGARLALAARAVVYGDKDVVHSGPTLRSYFVRARKDGEGTEFVLRFDHAAEGLAAADGEISGFFAAERDGPFVPVEVRAVGSALVVRSDQVRFLSRLRYGWADNPQDADLINSAGLPATPFRIGDPP